MRVTLQPMEAQPTSSYPSQDNPLTSAKATPSTRMWQNPNSSRPIIDLTAPVEEETPEVESVSQPVRVLNRVGGQLGKSRLQLGTASRVRKMRPTERPSTTSDSVDPQSDSGPGGSYDSSAVVEPSGHQTLSHDQQGHFTLCPSGRALRCNHCKFQCRRTSCGRMIKHIQVHGIRSRNQCKSCGVGFLHKSELEDHQKVCAQASLAPQCTICGKTFSYRSLLNQHMSTHVGKRPYRCASCPMSFSTIALCKLHREKHHPSGLPVPDEVNTFQPNFARGDDRSNPLQPHIGKGSYNRNASSRGYSASSGGRRVSKVQRPKSLRKSTDRPWIQTSHSIGSVSSSGLSSMPVSIQAMTMPIVVSVSSQSMGKAPSKAPAVSSFTRTLLVDKASELTAGSPERIDDVHPPNGGLVYMRRELNPDVRTEDQEAASGAMLRTWSVSESSDPMGSTETAILPVDPDPDASHQIVVVKKEADEENVTDVERTSIVSAGMSSVESSSLTHTAGAISPLAYPQQQHEPTSTARDSEPPHPIDLYPAALYKPQGAQNLPGSYTDTQQRLSDASRAASGLSSPEGRKTSEDPGNPESPCGATSTRRSVDGQDNFSGPSRCAYCDITFGNPVMHYLHMGWHVTGEPWKCNGCGEECDGKVGFFLHLYKAGHK